MTAPDLAAPGLISCCTSQQAGHPGEIETGALVGWERGLVVLLVSHFFSNFVCLVDCWVVVLLGWFVVGQ